MKHPDAQRGGSALRQVMVGRSLSAGESDEIDRTSAEIVRRTTATVQTNKHPDAEALGE